MCSHAAVINGFTGLPVLFIKYGVFNSAPGKTFNFPVIFLPESNIISWDRRLTCPVVAKDVSIFDFQVIAYTSLLHMFCW